MADITVERLIVVLIVLAATILFAAWWRARDGRVAVIGVAPVSQAADIVAAVAPTTPLVLVEFTAPRCVPCVQAKMILDDVAADRDDLSVVILDVAAALDLARTHNILRAPTTLLVSGEGQVLGRVSGVPRVDELTALLDGSRQASAA